MEGPPADDPIRPTDQVLFEFAQNGTSVRAAAIHVRTNTEAVVVCPASYTRFSMEQAVLRKLRFILRRQRGN